MAYTEADLLYQSFATKGDEALDEHEHTPFQEEQLRRRRNNPAVCGERCLLLFSAVDSARRAKELEQGLVRLGADLAQWPEVHRDWPSFHLRLAGMTFNAAYGSSDFSRGYPITGAPYYTTYKFRHREIYDGYGKIGSADLAPYPHPSVFFVNTPLVATTVCRAVYMQCMARQDIAAILETANPPVSEGAKAAGPSDTSALTYYRVGDEEDEDEMMHLRDFVCFNGTPRQNTPNYWATTINNHKVAYQNNNSRIMQNAALFTPVLFEICPYRAEEDDHYIPGATLLDLDVIRVFPASHTVPRLPRVHTQVAGQLLACHGPHCGGKLDTNVYAVHTSEEANGDATWRIIPVGPREHGLYLIVKVDKYGRLGGTAWQTRLPMVLTIMPPTVLAEGSMTASSTMPLVIAPYDIAKEGATAIPKHFLWRFPCPLGIRASQAQEGARSEASSSSVPLSPKAPPPGPTVSSPRVDAGTSGATDADL